MTTSEPSDAPGPGASHLGVIAMSIVASILPVFLIGTLSVRIRAELGYGETVAGLVLAAFFGASALVSSRLGRWVDEVGPRRALSASLSAGAMVQLAIAAAARRPEALALLAAVGGVANATAQLGANVFIARYVPLYRQGIGFAVKQSAMPGGSLVAGLTLPTVATTLGWRWAFVAGACLSAAALAAVRVRIVEQQVETSSTLAPLAVADPSDSVPITVGADEPAGRDQATDSVPTSVLLPLAVAAAFATGAAITLGGFFVESAIDAGVAIGTAGLAFAAGSVISIIVRLAVGAAADRREGDLLRVVAAMIALGALTSVWFTWRSPQVQLIGVPLAFGAGWAWPGLFNLAVVRAAPGSPGRATGITQTGTYLGGAIGPIVFGAVAEQAGYSSAWFLAAGLGLAAAGAVLFGRHLLRDR